VYQGRSRCITSIYSVSGITRVGFILRHLYTDIQRCLQPTAHRRRNCYFFFAMRNFGVAILISLRFGETETSVRSPMRPSMQSFIRHTSILFSGTYPLLRPFFETTESALYVLERQYHKATVLWRILGEKYKINKYPLLGVTIVNGITPMTVTSAPKIVVRNIALKLNAKQNAQGTFFLKAARLVCWAHRPVPVQSRRVDSESRIC